LSGGPSLQTSQKPTRTKISRLWNKSRNSQNKGIRNHNFPKILPEEKKVRKTKNKQNQEQNRASQKPKSASKRMHEEARAGHALSKCAINAEDASNRQSKETLAVWNPCNMVSCNVVYARDIQEALPTTWHAPKHCC